MPSSGPNPTSTKSPKGTPKAKSSTPSRKPNSSMPNSKKGPHSPKHTPKGPKNSPKNGAQYNPSRSKNPNSSAPRNLPIRAPGSQSNTLKKVNPAVFKTPAMSDFLSGDPNLRICKIYFRGHKYKSDTLSHEAVIGESLSAVQIAFYLDKPLELIEGLPLDPIKVEFSPGGRGKTLPGDVVLVQLSPPLNTFGQPQIDPSFSDDSGFTSDSSIEIPISSPMVDSDILPEVDETAEIPVVQGKLSLILVTGPRVFVCRPLAPKKNDSPPNKNHPNSSHNSSIEVKFLPYSNGLPLVFARTSDVIDYQGIYLLEVDSIRKFFVCGHIVKYLGKKDDVSASTFALAFSHNILEENFSQELLNKVEKEVELIEDTAHQSDLIDRVDYRHLRVVSIDPSSARDLDDALSVEVFDDFIRVGVHIADVSLYVNSNSVLDSLALERSTSYYLPSRVIRMLPPLLSELVCSLEGEEKNSFSCFVKFSLDFEILEYNFERTTILPSVRLAYGDAQRILFNNGLVTTEPAPEDCLPNGFTLNNGVTMAELEHDLCILWNIAKKLRSDRFESGALVINSPKLKVRIGNDFYEDPDLFVLSSERTFEANNLIEEFMLLANRSAAEFTYKTLPFALLRQHDAPPESKAQVLYDFFGHLNYDLDLSDGLAYAKSLAGVKTAFAEGLLDLPSNSDLSPELFQDILHTMAAKSSSRAMYRVFSSSSTTTKPSEMAHFGLAADFYTHFTSPIRRYPDIIVHRLVSAAMYVEKLKKLGITYDYSEVLRLFDVPSYESLCQSTIHFNETKHASRLIDGDAAKLHLIHWINKFHKGKYQVDAYVLAIEESMFDVYIPQFCVTVKVGFKGLNHKKIEDVDGKTKVIIRSAEISAKKVQIPSDLLFKTKNIRAIPTVLPLDFDSEQIPNDLVYSRVIEHHVSFFTKIKVSISGRLDRFAFIEGTFVSSCDAYKVYLPKLMSVNNVVQGVESTDGDVSFDDVTDDVTDDVVVLVSVDEATDDFESDSSLSDFENVVIDNLELEVSKVVSYKDKLTELITGLSLNCVSNECVLPDNDEFFDDDF
ncbi:hypothetical protein RCL1_004517 [Eukaryota sp. TZLM3-RCL]